MENYSRWLPTREATAYLGVSSQFLKKNRDIKNGFLYYKLSNGEEKKIKVEILVI